MFIKQVALSVPLVEDNWWLYTEKYAEIGLQADSEQRVNSKPKWGTYIRFQAEFTAVPDVTNVNLNYVKLTLAKKKCRTPYLRIETGHYVNCKGKDQNLWIL